MPVPTPGPGEVLIKADAIGVNFTDTYLRSGLCPRELPFILGSEGCGTVIEVGDGVTSPRVGDRVAGAPANGAYAEYCVAPAGLTVKVPDDISSETAASALLK